MINAVACVCVCVLRLHVSKTCFGETMRLFVMPIRGNFGASLYSVQDWADDRMMDGDVPGLYYQEVRCHAPRRELDHMGSTAPQQHLDSMSLSQRLGLLGLFGCSILLPSVRSRFSWSVLTSTGGLAARICVE